MNKKSLPLLEALIAEQKVRNLSDEQFARLLRVHRSTWVLIKHGDRPVNLVFLQGVARAFPNLDDLVFAFLRGE